MPRKQTSRQDAKNAKIKKAGLSLIFPRLSAVSVPQREHISPRREAAEFAEGNNSIVGAGHAREHILGGIGDLGKSNIFSG